MRIRSRIIYPVSRPPIENGGLFISNGRFAAVGDWAHISKVGSGEIIDLGEVLLLPGLINAHCHLDYTDMAGKIAPPKHFSDWIKAILAVKASWSFSEYAASWLRGTEMLLHTGTTTVADIEAVPELLPELWASTALRVISYLEMTGVKSDRPACQILNEALQKLETLQVTGKNGAGLSPHALYSTKPDLLKVSAEAAAKRNLPTTMHVAESSEEFEMYSSRCGALFDWLKTQRDMADCGNVTPIQQLVNSGLMDSQFLAVHVNYLGDGDAQLVAEKNCSVVHCPSSHAYFQHAPFPFEELTKAGVNVCLGTDSLASCKPVNGQKAELNMFLEMQRFAEKFPDASPDQIIRMATVNAAQALQKCGLIGEIAPEACADFVALPLSSSSTDVATAILNHRGSVSETWVAGNRVFGSGQ
ncbi:MAG: amidohydrolase family protein [Verrucomicrobia bacterium]|nr:amidohydrolase family protein [Verrucomicrobiota bacterium]